MGTLQATSAAVSSGIQGSIFTQENSLSRVCSANAPTMQKPPSGSPSSRNGNVPLGSCPLAIVAPLSQRFDRPAAQNRQCPQAGRKLVTTWSPGATAVTPGRRRGRRRSPRGRRRSGTDRRGWSAAGARRSGRGRRRPSRPAPRRARGRAPRARRSRTRSPPDAAPLLSSARGRLSVLAGPPMLPRPPRCGTIGGCPPTPPPSRPRPAPAAGRSWCGRPAGALHGGASASCARLFEVTLRGLREEAGTDPAAARGRPARRRGV